MLRIVRPFHVNQPRTTPSEHRSVSKVTVYYLITMHHRLEKEGSQGQLDFFDLLHRRKTIRKGEEKEWREGKAIERGEAGEKGEEGDSEMGKGVVLEGREAEEDKHTHTQTHIATNVNSK